jgi:hypothetical protein
MDYRRKLAEKLPRDGLSELPFSALHFSRSELSMILSKVGRSVDESMVLAEVERNGIFRDAEQPTKEDFNQED